MLVAEKNISRIFCSLFGWVPKRCLLQVDKMFVACFYQDGARIADSVARGKVASTLEQGSWINIGNLKGTID